MEDGGTDTRVKHAEETGQDIVCVKLLLAISMELLCDSKIVTTTTALTVTGACTHSSQAGLRKLTVMTFLSFGHIICKLHYNMVNSTQLQSCVKTPRCQCVCVYVHACMCVFVEK